MPAQLTQYMVLDLQAEDHTVKPTRQIRQAEILEADQARRLQEGSLSATLKMQVSNYFSYSDGFSFTVATELEAYKAAYAYRTTEVKVVYAENVGLWSVSIYTKRGK